MCVCVRVRVGERERRRRSGSAGPAPAAPEPASLHRYDRSVYARCTRFCAAPSECNQQPRTIESHDHTRAGTKSF